MQNCIKEKFQFYTTLTEIDKVFTDNKDFVEQAKKELFSEKIYVYTPKGETRELPKGSNVVDFAYNIGLGNIMDYAIVNDEVVSPNYILKTKDRVKIVTNKLKDNNELSKLGTTTKAKVLKK